MIVSIYICFLSVFKNNGLSTYYFIQIAEERQYIYVQRYNFLIK